MSQVDAKSFFERVTKNEAVRRDVMSKLQESAERTPQQLIQLGAQHGLTFTETELVDAWEESQSTDQRALSDSELDGVTGGTLSDSELDGVTGETASLKLAQAIGSGYQGQSLQKGRDPPILTPSQRATHSRLSDLAEATPPESTSHDQSRADSEYAAPRRAGLRREPDTVLSCF